VDAAIDDLGGEVVGVEVDVQLLFEDRVGQADHPGVAERPHRAAAPDELGAHPQAMERLPQLQPDDARADDEDALGEIGQLKDVLVGEQQLAGEARQGGRDDRGGARGEDDGAGADLGVIVDLDRVALHEAAAPREQLARRRQLGAGLQHEAGEEVAQLAHAAHHRRAVHATGRLDAEGVGVGGAVRRLRGRR
jgi:hypothetical protein